MKFHDLLPVLEPEKRKFITTCIVLLFHYNYGYLQFTVTPINLIKAGMASRNIVMKKQYTMIWSALQ